MDTIFSISISVSVSVSISISIRAHLRSQRACRLRRARLHVEKVDKEVEEK